MFKEYIFTTRSMLVAQFVFRKLRLLKVRSSSIEPNAWTIVISASLKYSQILVSMKGFRDHFLHGLPNGFSVTGFCEAFAKLLTMVNSKKEACESILLTSRRVVVHYGLA